MPMMARVLQFLGVVLMVCTTLIMGSFLIVALMGFIGTQGREAGDMLLGTSILFLFGNGLAVFLIKLGTKLLSKS